MSERTNEEGADRGGDGGAGISSKIMSVRDPRDLVTEQGVPVQWKISEKSVALSFGFQINSFCAASCLLKILQLRREIQEQEREREGERPACLLEILQFWGKRWQKRERPACLLKFLQFCGKR